MIIVCPECSTKFKVDSARIPERGAKVRCARCKHVFLAEKPLDQESPIVKAVEASQEVPTSASMEQHVTPDENFAETTSGESDFSYDKFQELDSNTEKEETFTFGVEREPEDDSFFDATQDIAASSSSATEDSFTFTEATGETDSPSDEVLAAEDADAIVSEPAVKEEVGQEASVVETPAQPESPTQPVPEKKGGPVTSLIRILLLLILGILIIGGVFVYMNGTDQLNQTIQQIFGQQIDQPVQTGQITLSDLEGKFIQNEQDGELFLIRGEAINNFTEPRAAIQVKGVIFDQNGKPLLQKTVFCGNPIDDQKLSSLSFLELEKIMGNQFGNELSNMKIDSKQSIPFDIVFKDLPKNLSEFSVKVTSSQSATN